MKTAHEAIAAMKAEIGRRRDLYLGQANACIGTNIVDGLDEVLTFLDTLPEQPVSEGLDEAAEKHISNVFDAVGHPGWDWEMQDVLDAFKAGAKWMAEQGESHEGVVTDDGMFIKFNDDKWVEMIALDPTLELKPPFKLKDGDKVIVQIRRKI